MRSKKDMPSAIELKRRADIIQKAIETIADVGYEKTSLARIADRVELSKGTILYHFSNKDALIKETALFINRFGAAFMIPRLLQHNTARAKLKTYIEGSMLFMQRYPEYMTAIVEIFQHVTEANGLRIYDEPEIMSYITDIESILIDGQKNGELRQFSAEIMAITIRQALDAVPFEMRKNKQLDLETYGKELAELFDIAVKKSSN